MYIQNDFNENLIEIVESYNSTRLIVQKGNWSVVVAVKRYYHFMFYINVNMVSELNGN